MEITVPSLHLPGFVLLPACTATLHIGPEPLLRQLEMTRNTRGLVCLVEESHYRSAGAVAGCLAQVMQVTRQPTGWNVHFRGLRRLQLLLEIQVTEGVLVRCRELAELPWESGDPPEFPQLAPHLADFRHQLGPGAWLDIAALHLPISITLRQQLLTQNDPNERARLLKTAVIPKPKSPRCHLN